MNPSAADLNAAALATKSRLVVPAVRKAEASPPAIKAKATHMPQDELFGPWEDTGTFSPQPASPTSAAATKIKAAASPSWDASPTNLRMASTAADDLNGDELIDWAQGLDLDELDDPGLGLGALLHL